ncbi:MAG: hypothetical protein JWP91_303 [Fibrobacteres bacterium]|nr:hypothetical protein [Fibrobacterota bacterium]
MNKQEELAAFAAIKDELLSLLEPLDEERMNRVPFPGSWTAGQLGEHVLKSFLLADLSKVRTEPNQGPMDGKSPQIDGVFMDFTRKFEPPAIIVPSSERISGKSLMADLRNAADGIDAFARGHDLSFTSPDFAGIGFGPLTAQEWIHFLSAHCRRHVRQLRNIVSRV